MEDTEGIRPRWKILREYAKDGMKNTEGIRSSWEILSEYARDVIYRENTPEM